MTPPATSANLFPDERPASKAEVAALGRLEQEVLAGLDRVDRHLGDAVTAAKSVRHALLEIRERGLYRLKAGTWEGYVREFFKISKARAHQHLSHAKLERLLSLADGDAGDLLKDYAQFSDLLTLSQNQAGALWSFPLPVQLEAWRRACGEEENPRPVTLRRHAEAVYYEHSELPLFPGQGEDSRPEPGSIRGRSTEPGTPQQQLYRWLGTWLQRIEQMSKDYPKLAEWSKRWFVPAVDALDEVWK